MGFEAEARGDILLVVTARTMEDVMEPVFVALFVDLKHNSVVVDNDSVEVPLRHLNLVAEHKLANRYEEQ